MEDGRLLVKYVACPAYLLLADLIIFRQSLAEAVQVARSAGDSRCLAAAARWVEVFHTTPASQLTFPSLASTSASRLSFLPPRPRPPRQRATWSSERDVLRRPISSGKSNTVATSYVVFSRLTPLPADRRLSHRADRHLPSSPRSTVLVRYTNARPSAPTPRTRVAPSYGTMQHGNRHGMQ